MHNGLRRRRLVVFSLILFLIACAIYISVPYQNPTASIVEEYNGGTLAIEALDSLETKGLYKDVKYERSYFGNGWANHNGCSVREMILNRDLENTTSNDDCQVLSGILKDPYTGKLINFSRGAKTSSLVQIDHVVALSNAWQTGAFNLSSGDRLKFANDSLELLAVDGRANGQKSGSAADEWLPSNKVFRCIYVARQIAVKQKYKLWVTLSERRAINGVLDSCPTQVLPNP